MNAPETVFPVGPVESDKPRESGSVANGKSAIMARKTKDRAGGHQATTKTLQCDGFSFAAKAAVITPAVWGRLPTGLPVQVSHLGGAPDV